MGELRMKNFEIYRLMENIQNGYSQTIGFILIEDCNRSTKLEDYPFLIDVYKDNPNEFEAGNNLIKVRGIVAEPLNDGDLEVIEHIGISLVESKENVDCLFSVVIEPNLEKLVSSIQKEPFKVFSELLKFTDQKPILENLSKKSLERLYLEH